MLFSRWTSSSPSSMSSAQSLWPSCPWLLLPWRQVSFLRNFLDVRNFLYYHLLGIGCAIIFTGVPVYFIIVSDDYVKKPEYVRRFLGEASLITTAWIFNSSPCTLHPILFQEYYWKIPSGFSPFSCNHPSILSQDFSWYHGKSCLCATTN